MKQLYTSSDLCARYYLMADPKDNKTPEIPVEGTTPQESPTAHVSQQQLGNAQALDILSQGGAKTVTTGLTNVELFDSSVDTGRVVPRQNYNPKPGETVKDIATRAVGPGATEEQVRQFTLRLMKENHILDANAPLNRRTVIVPEHTYVGREVNHGQTGPIRLRDGRTTVATNPTTPNEQTRPAPEGNVRMRAHRPHTARVEQTAATPRPTDNRAGQPQTPQRPAEDPNRQILSQKDLEEIARAIDKAANGGLTGIGTDKETINDQLRRLKTRGDADKLDEIYKKLTGHGIVAELEDELGGSDLTKSMKIWNDARADRTPPPAPPASQAPAERTTTQPQESRTEPQQRGDRTAQQPQQPRPEAADPTKPTLNEKEIQAMAKAIDQAANGGLTGIGTDKDAINEQLKRLKNQADRDALDKAYRTLTGHGIVAELEDELEGSDLAKSMGLWNGATSDTTRVNVALTEHKEWTGRSTGVIEKDLRDTISTMNSQQIADLDADYRKQHGIGIREALLNDPKLPKATKEALEIYLKGTDNRTPEDTQRLGEIALRTRNLDMFQEAFRDAKPEARKAFLDAGGKEKIERAFGIGTEDANHALEYVNAGKLSTATKVRDNTGSFNDNEEAIELTLKNMTPEERKAYVEGKKLAANPPANPTEEQRKAIETYNTIHKALTGAGNEREVMKWEDMIANKDGGLVTKLAAHGGIIDDGMDKVLKTIEDMSEEDWKRLKSDPKYLEEVRRVLAIDLNEDEMRRANELIDKKLKAETFKDSKAQQRSITEAIDDQTGFWNNSEEGILESIKRMTPEEQRRYREDEQFRKQIDDKIKATMDEGHEQKSAMALLDAIRRGEDPKENLLSKLHEHADHFNTDEAKVIADLEKAFKDPKFKERMQNDPEFRKQIDDALRAALEPHEYERYAKPIMEGGRLSFAVKAELYQGVFNDDEKELYEAVKNATEEDWNEIIADPEKVLHFLSAEEREVALNIARQKGEMRPEDKIRAAQLGAGTEESTIKEVLAELTPEQTEKVKAEYLRKYGTDMMGDLLEETGGKDRAKILTEVREQPANAREAFNQARDDVYKSVDGIGRGFVDGIDGTADMTMDDLNQFAAGMERYSAKYQEMPLEERQKFEKQLAEALDLYKESESSAADMLVDGAIIAVGIAGAKFTGGVSLSLLAYTSLGGALFKVGAKAAIMGADYDFASADVLTDAATGGIDAATIFLGPAQAAQMLKIGERSAATAARTVLASADDVARAGGRQILKEGTEEALEKKIFEQVAFAISNGSDSVDDKAIRKIAEQFAASADDVPQLERMIGASLNQAVAAEASNVTRATLREVALNSLAGNVGGGLSGTVYGAAEWDPAKSLDENLAMLGTSALGGATTGTLMAGGMTLGFKALGKGLRALRNGSPSHAPTDIADQIPAAHAHPTPDGDGNLGVAGTALAATEGAPVAAGTGLRETVNETVNETINEASDDVAKTVTNTGAQNVGDGAHQRRTSGTGETIPGAPGERNFEIGDAVVANGDNAILAGVDESTGRAILRYPDRAGWAVRMQPLEDPGLYRTVEINGKPYLADEHGIVYSVIDVGEGKRIFPKHEYRIAPLDARIEHIPPPPVKPQQAVRYQGEDGIVHGFDPETGDVIVNLPKRQHYASLGRQVDTLEGFTELPVGEARYVRDAQGLVYDHRQLPNGKHMLLQVQEYRVVKQNNLEVRPHVVDDVTERVDDAVSRGVRNERPTPNHERIAAPEIPKSEGFRPGPHHFQSTDIYEGAELSFGGQSLGALRPDGQPVELGRRSLGLEFRGANEQVSSKHATVKWDPAEQMFYLEEHSLNGTYIKRAGETEYTHFPGGKDNPYRIYMGPNDSIRLGSIEGPEVHLRVPHGESLKPPPGPKGDAEVRIFFDGKPLPIDENGEVLIGRKHQTFGNESPSDILNRRVASNHAKLRWDEQSQQWQITDLSAKPRATATQAENRTIMIREGGNGIYIKRENGTIDFLQGESAFIGANDKIHLGSPDGPELKFITTDGVRQQDGRVVVNRKNYEQAIRRPDGTTEVSNFLGFKKLEDQHGRVIQTIDPTGHRVRFDYDGEGELSRIRFDDNSVAELKDGAWVRTASDGTQTPFWKGDISVENDGSIKFTDQGNPPRSTIQRRDGSREIIHPNGRVEYTNVDFLTEVSYMNRISQSFEDPAQGRRFKTLMNAFEARANATGLSKEEQALTFHQIRRLMSAEEGAFLTAPERSRLAEQILNQAGNPHVDQGFNSTCNVTTVEHRMFARKPSEAARLIADVVMTGKYVTADGTTVDLGRIPGVLAPDGESRRLAQRFDPNGADLKIDGKRTYASQIFETTAVNLQWAKSKEYNIRPGDLVIYEKPAGPVTSGTGEQLVRYSVDRNGFLKREVIGDAPKIKTHDLTNVYNTIAGTNERDFVIRHTANSPGPRTDSTYAVNSPEALRQSIEQLDKKGGMPAILLVHTGHEPFFTDSGAGLAGGSGGWHVVNVHGVRRDASGRWVADVTNQWGRKADHMGDRAIPLDQLFASMDEPRAPVKQRGLLDRLLGRDPAEPVESTGRARAAATGPNPDLIPETVADDLTPRSVADDVAPDVRPLWRPSEPSPGLTEGQMFRISSEAESFRSAPRPLEPGAVRRRPGGAATFLGTSPELARALDSVDPAVGYRFNGHGIAKGNAAEQLQVLDRVLRQGIDADRTFYEMPLRGTEAYAGAFGAARPFDSGGFILLSRADGEIHSDGVRYVLVNEHFYNAIPELEKAYPHVTFIKAKDAPEELARVTREAGPGRVLPEPLSADEIDRANARMEALRKQTRREQGLPNYVMRQDIESGGILHIDEDTGRIHSIYTFETGSTQIDYHKSGEIKTVTHGNGVSYSTENGVDWHVVDATAPGGSYDIRGRMSILEDGRIEWQAEGAGRNVRNPDGSVVMFNRETGRMEGIKAYRGSTVEVSVNESNELRRVRYPNGITYTTVDGVNWHVVDRTAPNGGYDIRGSMTVKEDGTLTWRPEGGDLHVRKPSGEVEVRKPLNPADDIWDIDDTDLDFTESSEPRKRKMFAPARDIQKMTSDERWQLLQDIDPIRSPLNTDRAAENFVERVLPQLDEWRDLTPLSNPLKESQIRYERAVSDYQTMLDTTLDLPMPAYANTDVAREFFKNDPDKLAVLNEYIMARDRRNLFSQHLEQQLESRRQALQDSVNEFGRQHGLPPVEVKLRDGSHMGSAKASYRDGEITLNREDLIKKDNGASLLGSLYHELTHADQDNTILRGLADELRIARDYDAANIDALAQAYRDRTNRGIDRDFVNRVLFNRSKLADLELSPEDQLRLPGLIDAMRNNSPVGEMWMATANDFRVTNSALKKMASDDPNAVITILKKMHKGDGTQTSAAYNMHIFGTPEPPAEFTRYYKAFARFYNGVDEDAWSPEIARKARADMTRMLSERLDSLNAQRKDAYERYMQLHEKDAFVSGERARLAAKQRGAGDGEVPAAMDGVDWSTPADMDLLNQLVRPTGDTPRGAPRTNSGQMDNLMETQFPVDETLVQPLTGTEAIGRNLFGNRYDVDPRKPSLLQLAMKAGVHNLEDFEGLLEAREIEVFIHGTPTGRATELIESGGRILDMNKGNHGGRFFATYNAETAQEFAERAAFDGQKLGPTTLVGIALPRSVVDSLVASKQLIREPIQDRPGQFQARFEPGAIQFLKANGFFFDLDKATREFAQEPVALPEMHRRQTPHPEPRVSDRPPVAAPVIEADPRVHDLMERMDLSEADARALQSKFDAIDKELGRWKLEAISEEEKLHLIKFVQFCERRNIGCDYVAAMHSMRIQEVFGEHLYPDQALRVYKEGITAKTATKALNMQQRIALSMFETAADLGGGKVPKSAIKQMAIDWAALPEHQRPPVTQYLQQRRSRGK